MRPLKKILLLLLLILLGYVMFRLELILGKMYNLDESPVYLAIRAFAIYPLPHIFCGITIVPPLSPHMTLWLTFLQFPLYGVVIWIGIQKKRGRKISSRLFFVHLSFGLLLFFLLYLKYGLN